MFDHQVNAGYDSFLSQCRDNYIFWYSLWHCEHHPVRMACQKPCSHEKTPLGELAPLRPCLFLQAEENVRLGALGGSQVMGVLVMSILHFGVLMVPNIEQDYILLSGIVFHIQDIGLLGSATKKTQFTS